MRGKYIKLALAAAFVFTIAMPAAGQYRFEGVGRVVAMSDPHGAYDSMAKTLSHAGLLDGEGNWSGGDTHLVITGDLLDRGADSRRIMDLVMQLENQASDAGGRVHLTLGNHEVMNLVGDLRYVAPGEYAAFAAEETADERERWFQAFVADRQRVSLLEVDQSALREEFDKLRPAGFYAHRRAFGSDGKYGRWLMEKPLIVVVNDTAFVHGGMSPLVAELGLDRLNDEMRAQVADYVIALNAANDAGLIDPAVNFYQQPGVAETLLADPDSPADFHAVLKSIIALNGAPVHDTNGPLWYRGNVGCSLLTEGEALDASLSAIGARRVVIGHTPTVGRQVLERFGGKVIEIDTGMLSAAYQGSGFALIIDSDGITVAQEKETAMTMPVPHPSRVGDRDDSLDVAALSDLLTSGEITGTATDEAGRTIVDISEGDTTVQAVFTRSPRKSGLEPELAAYRLDQLLGVDLVPVTVSREVDGRRGTLQFLTGRARDERYRSSSGQGAGAWCPLQRQFRCL